MLSGNLVVPSFVIAVSAMSSRIITVLNLIMQAGRSVARYGFKFCTDIGVVNLCCKVQKILHSSPQQQL